MQSSKLSEHASDTMLRNVARRLGMLTVANRLHVTEPVEVFTDADTGERCAIAEVEATVGNVLTRYHFFCEEYPSGAWGADECYTCKLKTFASQAEADAWLDSVI
jgi:hypothetical protein